SSIKPGPPGCSGALKSKESGDTNYRTAPAVQSIHSRPVPGVFPAGLINHSCRVSGDTDFFLLTYYYFDDKWFSR
ncbi:MAG: hypothetical protein WBF29_16920, partial [Syntrophobacteria bacterium]